MKIIKIINNNIISSFDEDNREIIIMGKGIGFGVKPGGIVPKDRIEKIFRMDSQNETKHLKELLVDVPLERVQIVDRIIKEAQNRIQDKMQRSIYITLIDHINFAIERQASHISFHNPLSGDVKRFYPVEYKLGLDSIRYINETLEAALPEDEAASIALHFINAQLGKKMPETIDITKIMQNSIKIIKYHFNIELDQESLNYDRFITHLKFFAARIVADQLLAKGDRVLNQMIRQQYKAAYRCAEKIAEYIQKEYHVAVSLDELTYLTVHIERISNEAAYRET